MHTILFYSQWMFDKQEPTWRSRITVDDATNLPIRLETQKRKPVETRWITTETREEDFNQPVSAAVFVPDFPKTAWLIDAVAERDYWRRRLDKGVAASNTVVVRDLQVNANGVVFLLFTANDEVGRDIPFGNVKSVDLTDEFGTRYTDPSVQNNGIGSQNFVPTCMNITAGGEKVAGYLFGEKQLEGRRWVPVEKQTSWKPRQFRLTFHLQNLKSGQADTAVFDLPLQSAEADTVPKYMPYMGRSLSSDAGAEGDEEMDVRAYYLYHIAHDLPAALRAYRELLTYRAGAQNKLGLTYGWSSVQWLEVTHILIELGRIEEAKTALTQAKHDDDSARCSPATHEQIRTEMKKLGMDP